MADTGGGHGGHMQGQMPGHHMLTPRLVTDMVADPARPADVGVDLVTRQQMLSIGGRAVAGFTVNGTSPGPEIRARQCQLIEVHLRNESVADGVTLHWHGVDEVNDLHSKQQLVLALMRGTRPQTISAVRIEECGKYSARVTGARRAPKCSPQRTHAITARALSSTGFRIVSSV
jgi:hypothetical protein